MTKRMIAALMLSLSFLLPLASECSGNGNYDRWCYALNCDGRHDKDKK